MASNNFALTFLLSTSPPASPAAARDEVILGFGEGLVCDDRGDLEIWDCVNTTKDSLDLVEGYVRDWGDGEPFLEVGMTRLTSGVWGSGFVVFS